MRPFPFLFVFLPLLSFSTVSGAQSPADAHPATDRNLIDGVAAEVNGEPITLQEVMDSVRGAIQAAARDGRDLTAADLQRVYAGALDGAIRTLLVLQEYRNGDMKLPDWILDKRVSEIIDSSYGGDRTKLVEELAQRQTTFAEWRKEIEDATSVMALRQLNVDKNIHVGPAQVLDYYRTHEADFTRPAGTHMRLLLLKPGSDETPEAFEARVATIRKRLASEPFSELARFFSADASAARGGDWGWINPRETLRTELADALEALPANATSDPVVTSAGVYFLRNEGVRGDGLQPIESVRDEIVGILRRSESERLFREWTERLRSKADVRIFRPAM